VFCCLLPSFLCRYLCSVCVLLLAQAFMTQRVASAKTASSNLRTVASVCVCFAVLSSPVLSVYASLSLLLFFFSSHRPFRRSARYRLGRCRATRTPAILFGMLGVSVCVSLCSSYPCCVCFALCRTGLFDEARDIGWDGVEQPFPLPFCSYCCVCLCVFCCLLPSFLCT